MPSSSNNGNSNNNETDRLLQQQPGSSSGGGGGGNTPQQQQYYFLHKSNLEHYQGGTTATVKDADGGAVIEDMPANSDPNEFAPRPLVHHARSIMGASGRSVGGHADRPSSGSGAGSFWSRLFGGRRNSIMMTRQQHSSFVGGGATTVLKPRKAPIKIEPKVFFSNERTFLAWMHLSVILAGASIAILAFADSDNYVSQVYGVVLLPVAIAFVVYSMVQYQRRAYMIRNRLPGPYEDTVGPTVLCIMLMVSILVQFGLRLYDLQKN